MESHWQLTAILSPKEKISWIGKLSGNFMNFSQSNSIKIKNLILNFFQKSNLHKEIWKFFVYSYSLSSFYVFIILLFNNTLYLLTKDSNYNYNLISTVTSQNKFLFTTKWGRYACSSWERFEYMQLEDCNSASRKANPFPQWCVQAFNVGFAVWMASHTNLPGN